MVAEAREVSRPQPAQDEAGAPAASPNAAWRGWLALLLVAAAAAVALQPLWANLHHQWTTVNLYSHGYLLLAMALWLGWRAWAALPDRRLAPDWRWLAPLLAVLGGLAFLDLLFLNAPRLYLLPPLLVAGSGLLFGNPLARRMAGPALLLYFALPLWAGLQAPLQSLTTSVVTSVLLATRVPAYIEGNFVFLPAGTFEIATDCSGLNYLMIGMTLGVFCALAFLDRWRDRALLVAATVALTIVCNWVRVWTIIMAGHLTDMQHYLVAVDHDLFGWVLFGVFLLPALWLARRLQPVPGQPPATTTAPPAAHSSSGVVAAALVLAALLFLPAAVTALGGAPTDHDDAPAVRLEASGFEPGSRSPWQPAFAGAIEERATYAAGDGESPIEVYRAVYPWQTAEERLVRHGQDFTGRGWRPVDVAGATVTLDGRSWAVTGYEGYFGQRRYLVLAWYWVAGEPAHTSIGAKLAELRGLLRGRRDAQAIALLADCGTDCSIARERLRAFIGEHGATLRWQP